MRAITTWGDANTAVDPVVSSLSGATAYRVARVVPLSGYPALRPQIGNRGVQRRSPIADKGVIYKARGQDLLA